MATTATTATTTPRALPAGPVDRAGGDHLTLGALLIVAAELLFFGGLTAAYLLARSSTSPWPAEGVELGLYVPVVIWISLVMASATAEWACDAHRHDDRRALLLALGITVGLGAAYLNGQWFELDRLGLAADAGAYQTLFLALVGFHMAHVAGAALATLLVVVRVLGGLSPRSGAVRAVSVLWHLAGGTWLVLFWLLYLVK